MKLTLRHDLPCTPDEFWDAFFDPEVNDAMYRDALGCTDVTIEEQTGDRETGLHRVLRSTQPLDAPGPVKKLMGDTATTTETGDFADGTWRFTMRPDTMGDKIQISGTITAEPTDAGCTRVFEMEAKVKILAIGKVFEATIDKQTREAQDATAEFLRERTG